MRMHIRFLNRLHIKALLVSAFVFLIIFAVRAPAFAAAPNVVEAPHVRVVINGVPGSYTDSALEINARVLLPFRELLTKLGVTNDDEHIIWNEAEESVTVLDKGNVVWLQIGNPVMKVNGEEKTFDVAPYFHSRNDRTYIPVRAVSELLDKNIMWEEDTTTVYIRDKANYSETLELLEKMNAVGAAAKIQANADTLINYRVSTSGAPLAGADEDGILRESMEMSQLIMSDTESGIVHVKQLAKISGINIGTELFQYGDRTFMRIEGPGMGWFDAADQGVDIGASLSQISLIEEQMDTRPLSDIAMGLAMTGSSDGSYTLVGEPLTVSEMNSILDAVEGLIQQDLLTIFDMKINKFQIGTTVDSNYNPIKAVVSVGMDFSIVEKTAGGNDVTVFFSADMYITVNYERVGSEFTVPVPSGVASLLR